MKLPYHNLVVTHWNPGATWPLVLPIQVVCNTDDEQLYGNIRANSAVKGRKWVKRLPADDGLAILCGSGPSLADHLPEIKQAIVDGGTIFALNGAAKFLADHGIMPDYQVILDAQPATAQLVGPAHNHLFASQVDPSLFAAVPNAILWQLQVENIDDYLPDDQPEHCLVGGAASVGNTATCLAYALGYREIHCYGYDSSYRDGESHAFRQPMNDGDPSCIVNFNGHPYTTSLTMKLQAEKFPKTAQCLKDAGCKIFVHGTGLLPDIYNRPPSDLSEQEKYQRIWEVGAYRSVAPGELSSQAFLDVMEPRDFATVVDFGCGTGRGALKLKDAGLSMILVDFAENCRDLEAMDLPFVQGDLATVSVTGDYGYCTDVMEHIPPEKVDGVLRNIMSSVPFCFFRIDFEDDVFGAVIGEPLHLSVHEHDWWLKTFDRLGFVVSWSEDKGGYGLYSVKHRLHAE